MSFLFLRDINTLYPFCIILQYMYKWIFTLSSIWNIFLIYGLYHLFTISAIILLLLMDFFIKRRLYLDWGFSSFFAYVVISFFTILATVHPRYGLLLSFGRVSAHVLVSQCYHSHRGKRTTFIIRLWGQLRFDCSVKYYNFSPLPWF